MPIVNEIIYRFMHCQLLLQISENCPGTSDWYQLSNGECFKEKLVFDVDNCLLGVPLDMIDSGIYVLKVTSMNSATLSSSSAFEVIFGILSCNIMQLIGSNIYC
jgi:hypothetical protein